MLAAIMGTRKEVLRMLGQRVRLHVLNCEQHSDFEIMKLFKNMAPFDVDCQREEPSEIYRALKSSKYIPYSTIFIIINTECACRSAILHRVLTLTKRNKYLRYKTKLIHCSYTLNEFYRAESNPNITKLILRKYTSDTFLYPPLLSGSKDAPHFDNITNNDVLALKEHNIFRAADTENALLMQAFVKDPFDAAYQMGIMLLEVYYQPLISMNEMFVSDHTFYEDFLVQTSTNTDFYFYNINPALAIIINNYYFTSHHHGIREGSERDVQRLMRELKVAGIPYILIQDCNRTELLQILDYIERKDFKPLKSFLFFLMSHGGADNAIYTDDGQLDIRRDIVQRIQSNKSLQDAEKLVIANACRGIIDMEYADFRDLEQIKPTDAGGLDDNTILLYSVPNGLLSPRDERFGSPFMVSFCQNFRNIDHTQDIRAVEEKIQIDLENVDYYEDLDKRFDLVVGNASKSHCIIQIPDKAQGMLQLIESIIVDFRALQAKNSKKKEDSESDYYQIKTLFYVCGALRKLKEKFEGKYFTNELDGDHCAIDEEVIESVF